MLRHITCKLGIALLSIASLSAAHPDLRLVDAARRDDEPAARALLKARSDLNARDRDGSTPLLWVTYHDHLELADLLIAAGADVNVANEYGETPLSVACQNRNLAIVERLLKAGADPDAAKPSGETVLMAAVDLGSVDLVELLVSHGADVNATETVRGQTALMWAAARGDVPVAELLIGGGADIRAASKGGSTPLHFAVQQGAVPMARFLLEYGADPNGTLIARQVGQEAQAFVETLSNVTPLWLAISIQNEELGALLLDRGADPNAGEYRNIPPLHLAVQARMANLVHALLTHGANPNARAPESARPPKGAEENLIGHRSFFLMPTGATPFFVAAQVRDPALMRMLLAAGADPRIVADDQTTPLMAAAGVNDDRYRAAGPKQKATAEEVLEAVTLAMEQGSDINAVNDIGQTALHGAVGIRSKAVTQFLVDHGADVEIRDENAQNPLDLAKRTRVQSIIELLAADATTSSGR